MDVEGLVSQGVRAFGPGIACKSIINLSGKEHLESPESAQWWVSVQYRKWCEK